MTRWSLDTHTFVHHAARWGLSEASRENLRAARIERRWRWPTLFALVATIPAFYAELLASQPHAFSEVAYLTAALLLGFALVHVALACHASLDHILRNPVDLLLVGGLVGAAVLPPSHDSGWALGLRLAVAFLTLLRMVWSLQHLITRGGLAYLLMLSLLLFGACGLGFWWLEPTAHTPADGMWLAFTTAATVGYGDIVPTTHASKIFSVFVVLLGYGVLSLVTAAIAASWIETEERRMERDIQHELRRELSSLRREIQLLREVVRDAPAPANTVGRDPSDT